MGDMEFGLSSNEKSSTREPANKIERGSKKYLSMIDKGSKNADKKNLPFSFGGKTKSSKLDTTCMCPICGNTSAVSKNTVMVACHSCRNLYNVDASTITSTR
jgi:hypothetical protein